MTGWSSKPEWPSVLPLYNPEVPKAVTETAREVLNAIVASVIEANPNVDYTSSVHVYADENNNIKIENVHSEKVYNNLSPTHDPYTNPNAQLYYECKCGAILDPGTKSFASLNNAASNAGWKVRWKQNGEGYEPFCVECGKDVE